MRKLFSLLLPVLISCNFTSAQSYKILKSNNERLEIEFDFTGIYRLKDTTIDSRVYQMIWGGEIAVRKAGEPWLPEYSVNIAIPFNSAPVVQITKTDKTLLQNKLILPFPEQDPQFTKIKTDNFDKTIYSSNKLFPEQAAIFGSDFVKRYSRIIPLKVSPYQYNPVSHELIANKKVLVRIIFNVKVTNKIAVDDKLTKDYLKSSVINYDQALQWMGKNPKDIVFGGAGYGNYWYDPNKNYFKIYLRNKGVYRLTFDQLVNAGVPIQGGVSSSALELVNEGNSVPIDVNDGGDGIFNSGDYLQFVGTPPTPTEYCTMNIYNNSNVYWFSYQSDTLAARYASKNCYPQTWTRTFNTNFNTIHYEKDSLYETLGYAQNDHRDFWFWGKATAQGGQSTGGFEAIFPGLPKLASDSVHVKLRIAMQGLTLSGICENNHDAEIRLTDQLIGHALWGDQNNIIFQKTLYVSEDSIHIYPEGNTLDIIVRGNTCETSDEIRINWFELQYWRDSETFGNHYEFISPPGMSGIFRYWLTYWTENNMKIYVPSKKQIFINPELRNDQWNSALFVDTVNQNTDYYCVSDNYFLSPDSIKEDISSDLRNPSNGADYIIIYHPDFIEAAQRLKTLRESEYPDSGIINPRIKIVDINQIYDEFSNGLLNPQSLQDFVKYAFENWQSPAPVYVVLFGDMSHDYRHLLTSSKPNFIPSIPFYVSTYGLAPSDNLIVDVAGNDLAPDLAIGRMSCETVEEADVLVGKLESYPADNSKEWKQDVMLASSGLSLDDELHFHFNMYSNRLADNFLIPNGIHPSRVFNFPSNHEDSMYIGGGPRIRSVIDNGVVIGNYYGHGGGYQWDLIFTNDDIALLHNDGRLPVIMSVTCYTAHFDNQDVFGEIFNRLPGGGSIGFFGNTVLTYWPIGAVIDEAIFKEIFTNRTYTIGKAIFDAKNQVGGGGYYGQQITLLTYLGDPGLKLALPDKPDFAISPSDISISEENPLVNDTVQVKALIHNLGVTFSGDTINVEVLAESADTSYSISTVQLPNFGELDSVTVNWIPLKASLYNIKVKVNELDPIPENDHQDNIASNSFVVYSISEANVLNPQDGFSTSEPGIKFKVVDIGNYIGLNLTYTIQIDTGFSFNSPIISTSELSPDNGILTWTSSQLPSGTYFWRIRIFDGTNYGPWSKIRSFSIVSEPVHGFFAHERGLKMFKSYNLNFEDNSLQLNTSVLPPRPSETTFMKDIPFNNPITDTVSMTTITTDGTYLYFGSIWYFARSNPQGKSKIYKVGTGYNGTVEGQYYGEIPNFYARIANSITYYSDGYIYVAEEDPFHLVRLNPSNGDTTRILIPDGLLDWEHGRPVAGSYYLAADSQYVYNLSLYDTLGNNRYVLRTFNPANNWSLVRPDIELLTSSFNGFTTFYVADGYIYPSEDEYHNYMRRIRLSDGFFEDEWDVYRPWKSYYGWCYDWTHDVVIGSVFDQYHYGVSPKFSRFRGSYIDANGSFTTQVIGPSSKWNMLNYDMQQNSSGSYNNLLLGLNSNTKNYDTLGVDVPDNYSLQNISASDYKYLKMFFSMTDTTFNTTNPLEFKDLKVNFEGLPELMVTKKDLTVTPDSILQGLSTTMHFEVKNIGFVPADSVSINFYLNNSDSIFFNSKVNILPDSSTPVQHNFSTAPFIFDNNIKAIATYPKAEYFTFNNVTDHNFYIVRDSISPVFNITFDGKEIIDGDLVSAKPEVVITLKDNSPLPLDTSYFTLIHTEGGYANILHFSDPDVNYTYTPYPNSESKIVWHPNLKEGEHILEVLAKDASGNFFDTTSYRIRFEVVTEYDLRDVYNYPNPFKDGTYFTFRITGDKLPDELYVKIYTVAGRLIRTINIPSSELGQDLGFKKVYWDGRDEDGDLIANGIYFYKMIYKVKDVTKTVTQKLAKIR